MTQSYYTLENAPLAVLALLGTAAALLLAAGGALLALFLRRWRLTRWLVAGALALAGGYLLLLLAFSLPSRERTLEPGDRKYFCEIDCHVAYSIDGVSTTSLGNPPKLSRAAGRFFVVTVKTWFDPSTIASFRGNGPLTPNPREVFLVDEAGRRYGVSAAGQAALESERGGPSTPLSRELRPGESYSTTLAFDLPASVRAPRLFLGDPPGVEEALIGHENSPFHGKIYFALQPGGGRPDRSP